MTINKEPDEFNSNLEFFTLAAGWSNPGRRNPSGAYHAPTGEIFIWLELAQLKRFFGRARSRWKDNFKVCVEAVVNEGLNMTQVAQYRAQLIDCNSGSANS
jgi:hypothetical protein